ncbi:MAG: TrkA family potassium uptake protein [Oscillospiraceae bacterium]|nr:TrkA family potassium uptake protein [Oscillospiraceae bacterium]
MNILVVGCGKMGSQLTNLLYEKGHFVSVIDKNSENFEYLNSKFPGIVTQGIPIDLEALKKAGIEGCDALAAVTGDDNTNITVAQIAKKIFNVGRVIAAIQDPAKRKSYSNLGFFTICSTDVVVTAMESAIAGSYTDEILTFGQTSVHFSTSSVPKSCVGYAVSELKKNTQGQLFCVIHENGEILMFGSLDDYKLEKSDTLVFADVIN